MRDSVSPPETVTLYYRLIGQTHAFTSREYEGLFIGDVDLERAFNKAFEALGRHFSEMCGAAIAYDPEIPFKDFEAKVQTSRLAREHGIPLHGRKHAGA